MAAIHTFPVKIRDSRLINVKSITKVSKELLRIFYKTNITIIILFVTKNWLRIDSLVKVSDWNSLRTNPIYSEICIRANPNSFESIRKNLSIFFDANP